MSTCSLCKGKGYVMVKEYQSDRWVKVNCSRCAGGRSKTKGSDSYSKKSKNCAYCGGAGEVTIEASDGSPRICTCGHCDGSGNEP